MVECGGSGDSLDVCDLLFQRMRFQGFRRGARDDVRAERQLCVDTCLLVVRRGEDSEIDTEGKQQPDEQQSAVDRSAAATGARQQQPRQGSCPPPGHPTRHGLQQRAAQPHEQQGGTEP